MKYLVSVKFFLPSKPKMENLTATSAIPIWISGILKTNIGGAQGMVVVGMGEQNVIQRPVSQNGTDLFSHGIPGEAVAGIVQNGGFSVIDQKGAVPGDGPNVCDGEWDHGDASFTLWFVTHCTTWLRTRQEAAPKRETGIAPGKICRQMSRFHGIWRQLASTQVFQRSCWLQKAKTARTSSPAQMANLARGLSSGVRWAY